jgi:hypothetical protein
MPKSWVVDELEGDLGAFLSATMRIRLADLVPAEEREEANLEATTPVRTSLDLACEVRRTLAVTWSQLESITGISEQTFYDWKRNQRTARPSTLRKLGRVLALTRAVKRQLGADGAVEWFQSGSPSPVELMIGGLLESVEERAGMMLPSAIVPGSSSIEALTADEEHTPLVDQQPSRRPKTLARHRRRSRLPNRDR